MAVSKWPTSVRPQGRQLQVCLHQHSLVLFRSDQCDRRFQPRELRIGVDVKFDGPAYVGEAFEIHVDITNHDENAADISLDILLQPGEDDSREETTPDSMCKALS